jgi:hypothetical protein
MLAGRSPGHGAMSWPRRDELRDLGRDAVTTL